MTQPAIFLHSVLLAKSLGDDFQPDMVAGHSLGEFSALVAAGALSFEEGLRLVSKRAMAMQKACEARPSTMAAVLALPDEKVEALCAEVDDVVAPANYNCPGQVVISGRSPLGHPRRGTPRQLVCSPLVSPGQVVISGTIEGINAACEKMLAAGAKRAMKLKVGGAFHSPLMQPAQEELAEAIAAAEFNTPRCPIYQNVDGKPHTDPAEIKENLIKQLTAPVRWTYDVQAMVADGANEFVELGPGAVLQGLVKKIDRSVATSGMQ